MRKANHLKDKVKYEQTKWTNSFVLRTKEKGIADFSLGERFDIIWISGRLYLLQYEKLNLGALDYKKLYLENCLSDSGEK